MKTIVSITGIRPDFIRMSFIFKRLDASFNHILIHTGQHYDTNLSDIFFQQLEIRKPNYILEAGKKSANHYEQLAYLATAIPNLFTEQNINPDLILFLGDSNTSAMAFPLKKAGYRIGHIEAGMRSYDKRMLEEINRTVCDHCSDILFVYNEDYRKQLELENITKNVFVVGNTIVEPFRMFRERVMTGDKQNSHILMDIHRPENYNYEDRLTNAIRFGNECIRRYGISIKLLYFKRLSDAICKWNIDLGDIQMIPLMSYQDYLTYVYHSKFIISDSGTGQEEPALLDTKVVVPRDFTERPQSYENNCSFQLKLNPNEMNYEDVFVWLEDDTIQIKSDWLGDGTTSERIVEEIVRFVEK